MDGVVAPVFHTYVAAPVAVSVTDPPSQNVSGPLAVMSTAAAGFIRTSIDAVSVHPFTSVPITVYVPEDRYGQISLGQQAQVTVDSFPGETFIAEVIHIADQAEFTPRNVQTVEGRSSTVYAIKLRVKDSEGKLKIGMPADVVFK